MPVIVPATVAARALCVLLFVTAASSQAGAQEVGASKSELLRQAIVTPDSALLPLPAEVVCGPQVIATEVSPSRRSVIIVRQTAPSVRDRVPFLLNDEQQEANRSETFRQSGQLERQVLLWTQGSRRASVVWRKIANRATGAAWLHGVKWLAGTETALVQLDNGPAPFPSDDNTATPKPVHTTCLLRINATSGKTDTLTLEATPITGLIASPNAPVAVLKAQANHLYIVRVTGPIQGPLPPAYDAAGGEYVSWRGWLTDGKRLWGTLFGKAGEDGKSPSRPITGDIETGSIAEEKPGVDVRAAPAAPPALPYQVQRIPVILSRVETQRPALALWLEGAPAQAGERSLLAVGVDGRADVIALTSAVLFQQNGTLFVRPLVTLQADTFAAERQDEYRAEALRRAESIAGALKLYADLKGQGNLPSPSNVLLLLQSEFAFVEAETFNNPATGKPGFTAAYADLPLSAYAAPKTALLGYLASAGGRAAFYLDGHAVWEKAP